MIRTQDVKGFLEDCLTVPCVSAAAKDSRVPLQHVCIRNIGCLSKVQRQVLEYLMTLGTLHSCNHPH